MLKWNCFRPWCGKVGWRGRDPNGTIIWLKGKGCVMLWGASVVEILTSDAQPHAVYALGKQQCGILGAESTVWCGCLSLLKSHQIRFSGPAEYWLTGWYSFRMFFNSLTREFIAWFKNLGWETVAEVYRCRLSHPQVTPWWMEGQKHNSS